MLVQFDPSTTPTQQALVEDAIARSTFPWQDVSTTVTFAFTSTFDAQVHGGKAEALTDLGQLPAAATVRVNPGIIEAGNPLNAGYLFALETIIHELGHVVTLSLQQNDQRALADAIGCNYDTSWTLAETGNSWGHSGMEGVAETFKDLWLPAGDRRFANRTVFRLRNLAEFVNAVAQLGVTQLGGTSGGDQELSASWGPEIIATPAPHPPILAAGIDLTNNNQHQLGGGPVPALSVLLPLTTYFAGAAQKLAAPTGSGPLFFMQLRHDLNEAWPTTLNQLDDAQARYAEIQWETTYDPAADNWFAGPPGIGADALTVAPFQSIFAGPWDTPIASHLGLPITLSQSYLEDPSQVPPPYRMVFGWRPGGQDWHELPTTANQVARFAFANVPSGGGSSGGAPLNLPAPENPYVPGRVSLAGPSRGLTHQENMKVTGHVGPALLIAKPPQPPPPPPPPVIVST